MHKPSVAKGKLQKGFYMVLLLNIQIALFSTEVEVLHIPDGLLSMPVIVVTYAIMIAVVVYSAKKLKNLPENKIPLLGLFAAGIFAAQMVNFPIIGGVSGHLLGATLVAILLGPYAAVLVMTAVLIIQTLLFGDGGITALGANILNMGCFVNG